MPTKKPAACSAYTAIATFLRLRSSAMDLDPFLAGFEPRNDAHVATRHTVVRGEELDQCRVRPVVDRGRSDAHLEALAVLAGELRACRARLHVKIEQRLGQRFASTMRMIWMTMSSTSGVRSTPASGGMKRRRGRRNGAVTALNTGAIG